MADDLGRLQAALYRAEDYATAYCERLGQVPEARLVRLDATTGAAE